MTKYLELDSLVKEKNEVLQRLSHLPIKVRHSIPNSILLSEIQFNMLNNYDVKKKVIASSAMITKLEVCEEDQALFCGGMGTYITKYNLENNSITLSSEKIYFCNGLLQDSKRQLWVVDGKKNCIVCLDHNLVEKKAFQGLSYDRRLC